MNSALQPNPPEPGSAQSNPGFFCLTCRKKLVAFALLIFVIGAALLFFIPRYIDTGYYQKLIEIAASRSIGMKVSIGETRVSVWSGPGLILSNVMVSEMDRPMLTVKEIRANIALFKSLFDSFELEELKIIDPVVNLIRKRDGSFNFPFIKAYGPSKTVNLSDAAAAALATFKIVSLQNGSINWTDRNVSAEPVKERISNLSLNIARSATRKPIFFYTAGKIDNAVNPADFEIRGNVICEQKPDGGQQKVEFTGLIKIHRLNLARFWPYLDPYVPFQKINALGSLDIKGKVDLDGHFTSKGALVLSSIGIKYKQAFSSALRPRDMTISHDVIGQSNSLLIKEASIELGKMKIRSKGKISGLNGANPVFALELNTNQIDVDELKQFIPDNILTPQQSIFLEKYLRQGAIQLSRFTFNGDMNTLYNLDKPDSYRAFSGALLLSAFSFSVKGLLHDFEGIKGSIALTDNRLRFDKLHGHYGSSAIENISGVIEHLNEWPVFDIRLKADLNLEETREGLSSLLVSPKLKEHLDKITSIEGSIKLDLSVAGESRSPAETLSVSGAMAFDHVGMESPELGLPVHDMTGVVKLDLNNINIPGLDWLAGSSSFSLNGSISDVLKTDPAFDLRLVSFVNLADLDRIKYLSFGNIYNHSGLAIVDMRIRGKFNEFTLENRLDMSNAEYHFMNLFHKSFGFKNVYTFKGTVRDNDKLVIDRLVLDLGDSRIEVKGRIGRFLRGEEIDLDIRSDKVLFNDLDKFLNFFEDIDSEGSINGDFSIRKKSLDEPVRLMGDVYLKNARFKLPVFHEAFNKVDAGFELVNDQIFLKNGVGVFGDGAFNMSGVATISDKHKFSLNVSTQSLNLSDLFGPTPENEGETKPEAGKKNVDEKIKMKKGPNFFAGRWDIIVSSMKGAIGAIRYTDLDANIRYENRRFTISPLSFAANGGRWNWKADLYKLPATIEFKSELDIQDMDMESYFTQVAEVGKFASGPVNLRGKVSGEGKRWSEIKKSLDGNIQLQSGKGVIHRFNLLSKIFALLNVSQYFKLKTPDLAVKGMPFESISGNFTLSSGVAHTEDLIIDSEAMRISSVGDFDIGYNRIDMKIGVMPFITVDRVVSSIPVVGRILTGKNRSLLTSYFIVKGDLKNPETRSVQLESFAKGVIGIFQRLFEFPFKAFESQKKKGEAPVNNK
ncbi:MAG TPA: AsmA family protein [Nitrospirae bacterium]|nr:AsmA family protein [Nitrospirota bacterium]